MYVYMFIYNHIYEYINIYECIFFLAIYMNNHKYGERVCIYIHLYLY